MSKRTITRRPPDKQRADAPADTEAAPEDQGVTLDDVRQKAARVASGVAGGLNVLGALSKAAGLVLGHVSPAGPITGRGLEAIGEQLVGAAQSLGAASSLIGGSVVAATPRGEEEGVVDAEVVDAGGVKDATKVPPGRKPRRAE